MSEYNPTTDEVLAQIPEDNPFYDLIETRRGNGDSWHELYELLEEAYNPIDNAAYKDSMEPFPDYEAQCIVYDDYAVGGERRETRQLESIEPNESALSVEERTVESGRNELKRIEHIEQVGVSWGWMN